MCAESRRPVSRRAALRGAAALAAGAVLARAVPASARGRIPVGGQMALQIPFALGSLDPHRLDDPAAAILGEALFDSLYAAMPGGADVAAVIAEGAPEPSAAGRGLRIAIRKGLRTAHGRRLDARDVVFSIERARARGAHGWLADVPTPRLDGHDAIHFAGAAAAADSARLVRALSSPLVAIVPSSFSATTPDGTGPFRADARDGDLVLSRNPLAARGGSFLAQVTVRAAPDLSASLRAFETTTDDLGWLGLGLHEPRPGARRFDGGAVAWALLATGSEAGTWDQPGVAQALADGVPHARVSSLGVGEAWPDRGGDRGWGGSPCALFVRSDSPWLVELASVVAAALTRPGHEVVSRPVPAAELVHKRETRSFALAIDVARPLLGPAGSPSASTPAEARAEATQGALLGLTTADDPRIAEGLGRHPPRLSEGHARSLTRTVRVGVLGEIRVQGGRAADLVLPTSASGAGLDLGSAYRLRGGG